MKKGVVMRTTLDLPNDLLQEALKITNERNKTSLIVNSVKSVIRKHKLMQLIEKQGSIALNIKTDQLRKRKK